MRPARATDILSRDEIARLTRRSDARGALAVIACWATILATFGVLARFPSPVIFVLAVVVLGGRQLALTVLMHEAAHRTLFERRWLNDALADWVCARPVWLDVSRYRKHHVAHHSHTGTDRDPDRALVAPFPISRSSLARKLARDLFFSSGIRRAIGIALMDLGVLEYNVSGAVVRRSDGPRTTGVGLVTLARRAGGAALTNLVLLAALWSAGAAWTYAAWVVAWLTTYGLFLRVRALAEHACTEQTRDPFRNTRTTAAGLLARMTVAPLRVNYHLEHHFLVAVPWYRLPTLHALLRARGALDGAMVSDGYLSVLRMVTRRSDARA